MNRKFLLGALGAAALGVAGCNTTEHEVFTATATATAAFQGTKKKMNASMRMSEAIVVTLPPTPAPDDEWRVIFKDARLLVQTAEGKPTAAGTAMTFFARKPGRTQIMFACVRGAGDGAPVIDSCEIVITIRPPLAGTAQPPPMVKQ